jgi:hypothetical protein
VTIQVQGQRWTPNIELSHTSWGGDRWVWNNGVTMISGGENSQLENNYCSTLRLRRISPEARDWTRVSVLRRQRLEVWAIDKWTSNASLRNLNILQLIDSKVTSQIVDHLTMLHIPQGFLTSNEMWIWSWMVERDMKLSLSEGNMQWFTWMDRGSNACRYLPYKSQKR